ncbi:uncharacterized protein LOC110623331 [Manihot esculenta]|uniref:EF-hand domain-containing protein n=1 Tax=Manihot esculenta TaxID=3983 RepID=A0A2C9VB63_MANES|nr:uncharacterized protein LOC110623331 [Manihot esculenta]OAY42139.1 hypothetical protein MANES_09G156200v8 [Manihot esculenta]
MALAVVNGPTVTEFVEDKQAFETSVKECFEMLDTNGDGEISRDELCAGICKFMTQTKQEMGNLCDSIFERFDENKNGSIDPKEFRSLMEEIMFAMARGIGNSPVLMVLDPESLLMKAVQHEYAKK